MKPSVLAVIPARAGSKGLPAKNVAPLRGKPLIAHTIEHALHARTVGAICVTTDAPQAAEVARQYGVHVVDRPAELATDTASVVAALQHAVREFERARPDFRADVVVLLYANVPIRAADVVDRAVEHLIRSGADSIRTVAPIGKHHPDWLHRLDGDRMSPFRANLVHRRQDLEPLYYHDGAVVAVTRAALFTPPSGPDDHHAFFGRDRRALVQPPEATVDVDTPLDLCIADALLRHGYATQGIAPQWHLGQDHLWHRLPAGDSGAPRITGWKPVPQPNSAPQPSSAPQRNSEQHGVFVIAEAGVNHNGDIETAKRLIHAAREAGADAVKFQAFSADRLVARDAAACDYQKQHAAADNQHTMLKRLELSRRDFETLRDVAADCGIQFLATPFGVEDLQMLIDLDAPAIKIASSDLVNVPLLRAAARGGRPVILSTGAADIGEVHAAVALLEREGAAGRYALLHCVSRYPTPLDEANLGAIRALAESFDAPIGYSDHTPDVATGALAVAAGAAILEKHFTLDRQSPGPDHFFSLTPRDLAEYVRAARQAAAALGDGRIACTEGQREIRRLARGSIVAAADIAAGACLSESMLRVRRPGGGIDPSGWDRVAGRTAARHIAAGTPLEWCMLA